MDYTTAYKKYTQLVEEHNNTMIRLVSVTDQILHEELQEECIELSQKVAEAEVICKTLESSYLKQLTNTWLEEFLEFYKKQFIQAELSDVLLSQGFDLNEYTKNNRMHSIKSLKQKRELTLILNDIKRQIRVIDYQGSIIQTIGKYEDSAPLLVRCAGFSQDIDLCVVLK